MGSEKRFRSRSLLWLLGFGDRKSWLLPAAEGCRQPLEHLRPRAQSTARAGVPARHPTQKHPRRGPEGKLLRGSLQKPGTRLGGLYLSWPREPSALTTLLPPPPPHPPRVWLGKGVAHWGSGRWGLELGSQKLCGCVTLTVHLPCSRRKILGFVHCYIFSAQQCSTHNIR